jgi:hypothetical protein
LHSVLEPLMVGGQGYGWGLEKIMKRREKKENYFLAGFAGGVVFSPFMRLQ